MGINLHPTPAYSQTQGGGAKEGSAAAAAATAAAPSGAAPSRPAAKKAEAPVPLAKPLPKEEVIRRLRWAGYSRAGTGGPLPLLPP